MALSITQGPLPADGSMVDPAVFIAAWINNSTVAGLPLGAFTGGSLQFVVSQTNPPPTTERFVGLLWFERGAGRLYKWDKPDLPTGLTYSTADWIPLSERRMLWGRAVTDVPLGAPVVFATQSAASNADFITTASSPSENAFPRVIWAFSTGSGVSGGLNVYANRIPAANFVAYETALSGTLFRAVEMGFVTALVGSGETGKSGVVCIDDTRLWGYVMRDPTAGSLSPFMPIAESIDSSATNPGDTWLRPVFKHVSPFIGTSAAV